MGVSAWGMNVIELDAGCEGYPEHDHSHDGQEEVYVVLEGSAVLVTGGDEHPAGVGDMVRVPAEVTRKWVTRDQPVRLLALGATPGQAYAPDPRMNA
jgi:mannose-6-phosphate isomerase-like protein (cupin superfamily)